MAPAPPRYRVTLIPPSGAASVLPELRLLVHDTGESGGSPWPLYEGERAQVWMDVERHRVVRVLVEGETPAGYRSVALPLWDAPAD